MESINNSQVLTSADYLENNNDEDLSGKQQLFIEHTPISTKTLYIFLFISSLLCSCTSLLVLKRTKKIPYAAKFLSSGLLCFDILYMVFITVRKFTEEPLLNTSLMVLSTIVLQLGYVTITLMSVERFIMFYKPMIYLAKCTPSCLKNVTITIWVSTVTLFFFVRYPGCYLKFETRRVFDQAGQCNQIVTIYYITLVILALTISMLCYWSIFNMVKKQLANCEKRNVSFAMTANFIRSFKSTSLVLVYIFVIFVTSFIYAMIILYTRYMNLNLSTLRISLEVMATINCFLDPFLYVMWFKESQMELLRLFSCLNKKLKNKAEEMKYEIFDIVTSHQHMTTTL